MTPATVSRGDREAGGDRPETALCEDEARRARYRRFAGVDARRRALGLPVAELCRLSGCGERSYRRWIDRDWTPSWRNLRALERAMADCEREAMA